MGEWRFGQLPDYAFPRLRALLDGIEPGAPEISLAIGEPQHPLPVFIRDILAREVDGFGRYPPNDGTPEFRQAACDWLQRRYGLDAGFLDPHAQLLPLNGTREGLFNAALAVVPEQKRGAKPTVLMPNPFYQCYAAAALACSAEPVFVPAMKQTGFLPDFASLDTDLLARTAAIYVCAPANPQGTVADLKYWTTLLKLALEYDFVVMADECYAEIYDVAPPIGSLEAAQKICAQDGTDDVMEHLLSFHSLSKRSNLPGMRSGFVVGGRAVMERVRRLRTYGGAPSPLPVYAAATVAWSDDDHVKANRALYRPKLDSAERILGGRFGFYRPAGGFFLWLDVSETGLSGEQAAVKLWQEGGIRVLPGLYLARDMSPGALGAPKELKTAINPGASYLRLALVHDQETTEKALISVNQILS